MKVSLSWLKDYVDITMDAAELAEALTMAGLEVDSVSDRYAYLKGVIVGRIEDVQPHPNADKLRLCRVGTGADTVSVVCGAPNVAPEMLVPWATPGTELPDGTVIEKSAIRGEVSEGMLCSEAELGLGLDQSVVQTLHATLGVV